MKRNFKDGITIVVTNFLTIASDIKANVENAKEYLTTTYNIERMTGFNIDTNDIDNTDGDYSYDENYTRLKQTIINIGNEDAELKDWPTLLCQFTTENEITKDDLRKIQTDANDDSFTIINRWHLKIIKCGKGLRKPNPFTTHAQSAGYLSIIGKEISKCKHCDSPFVKKKDGNYVGGYNNLPFFMEANGIDISDKCPICGYIAPLSWIHEGECPECRDRGFKNTMSKSFEKSTAITD